MSRDILIKLLQRHVPVYVLDTGISCGCGKFFPAEVDPRSAWSRHVANVIYPE